MAPASETSSTSAMACALGIIMGIIERANSTQIGFSGDTVLAAGAAPPRRTASVRLLKFRVISGVVRKPAVVPR